MGSIPASMRREAMPEKRNARRRAAPGVSGQADNNNQLIIGR
jgi:hypothetical protein